MSTYQIGNTITWGLVVTDATGAAADVGTGPAATVTLPDGTTAAGSINKTATGTYTASYTAAQAGRHRVTWTGTGANSGGLPYDDSADVWPADPRLIISLAEARAALNVPSASVTNDDELRGYITAATIVIEHIVGAVLVATKVETHSGDGRAALRLAELPDAITTVTENGTTLAATGYCVDTAGLLWRGSRPGSAVWSATAPRNCVVTYTAGSAIIPDNIIKGAANLIRHWWDQGLQQSYYVGGEPEMTTSMNIAGYAVPNFVVDLLKPSMSNRVPGFA